MLSRKVWESFVEILVQDGCDRYPYPNHVPVEVSVDGGPADYREFMTTIHGDVLMFNWVIRNFESTKYRISDTDALKVQLLCLAKIASTPKKVEEVLTVS